MPYICAQWMDGYLDVSMSVEQEVLQLEVAVDNASVMQIPDGKRDLTDVELCMCVGLSVV